MTKCLVTKLNGIVNNNSILKMGEMRIKVNKISSPTSTSQKIKIGFTNNVNISIIGNGFFTDETLTNNMGTQKTVSSRENLYLSNGDYEISISDKYSIEYLETFTSSETNKTLNIEDVKFSNSCTSIWLQNSTSVSGDISELSNLTALTSLFIGSTSVSGDISELSNLTALTSLFIGSTSVSGDISELSNLTALASLNLGSTSVSGDISALSNLTALASLNLGSTSVSGDISALSNLTALKDSVLLQMLTLTGDLAKIPSNVKWFTNYKGVSSTFTWTTRPSSANILALECGDSTIDDVDKMLQNQAQCKTAITGGDASWYKTIAIKGNRTSASDTAVQTLQSKGYTVSVTPA